MTITDRIDTLVKARNILHKRERGEQLTDAEIALAHDYVDMVLDDLVDENFRMKELIKKMQKS